MSLYLHSRIKTKKLYSKVFSGKVKNIVGNTVYLIVDKYSNYKTSELIECKPVERIIEMQEFDYTLMNVGSDCSLFVTAYESPLHNKITYICYDWKNNN